MAGKLIPARQHSKLTVGKALRIARELQELTQTELAQKSGLSQPIISALENDRATLGAERAERLARVLAVHPGVLLFPNWMVSTSAASQRAKGSKHAA